MRLRAELWAALRSACKLYFEPIVSAWRWVVASPKKQYTLKQEILTVALSAGFLNAMYCWLGPWDLFRALDITVYQWIALGVLWLMTRKRVLLRESERHTGGSD